MGNSEVGHLNIGAGRVVYQDFTRIDHAIETGEFARQSGARSRRSHARAANGSDAARAGPAFARRRAQPRAADRRDGRDGGRAAARRASTCTRSSTGATRRRAARPRRSRSWTRVCARHPGARIASIVGRYYAMDRDQRWERVAAGVRPARRRPRAVHGAERRRRRSTAAYARGENDEFVKPTAIVAPAAGRDDRGRRRRRVHELPRRPRAPDDARADRPRVRRLSRARACRELGAYVCLTSYGDEFARLPVAFAPQTITQQLRRVHRAARARRSCASPRPRSTRTSPTSSTAASRTPYPGEDRILVPSPQGRDLRPQARDERARGHRQAGRRDRSRASTTRSSATTPTATWSATPATSTRRSQAVEALDACVGRVVAAARARRRRGADHRRPRQRRDDARRRDRPAAHRAHAQPRALPLRRPAGDDRAPAARCRTSRRRCSR